MTQPLEIAACDARTRLSELPRHVEQGGYYVIARYGRPVVCLSPSDPAAQAPPAAAVAAEIRAFGAGRQATSGEILQWREEGRR